MPLSIQKIVLTTVIFYAIPSLGKAVRSPKTATPTSPDPPLQTTSDGTCGNGFTCLGSKWGQCCSGHGYCGSSADYCTSASNCNSEYGTCDSSAASGPNPVISSDSGQACRTVSTETRTEISYKWLETTLTNTEVSTAVQTVTTTFIDIAFQTSVVTRTSTIPTVVTSMSAGHPSPTFPGTLKNCKDWYRIRDDVQCSQVIDVFGISKDDLRSWNPAMSRGDDGQDEKDRCAVGAIDQLQQGLCRVPCKLLWPGYYLCVGV